MSTTTSPTSLRLAEEDRTDSVSWSAILCGALAAFGATAVLGFLGLGLGFSVASPWGTMASGVALTASAAAWLVFMQWVSAAFGGYVAGRLRSKRPSMLETPLMPEARAEETYFLYLAHGFLAWAVSTLLVIWLLGSVTNDAVSQSASTARQGAGTGGQTASAQIGLASAPTQYYVDTLFRPAQGPAGQATHRPVGDPATRAEARAEAERILVRGVTSGWTEPDKARLASLVNEQSGLPEGEAVRRVDSVVTQVDQAVAAVRDAADKARKGAAAIALLGALSMLIGAFLASVAAVYGGFHRRTAAREA